LSARQILNQNSYVLIAALVLMVIGYFVATFGNVTSWIGWLLAALLLLAIHLVLRPGKGSLLSPAELEQLVGSGSPVVLELYSSYCLVCMAAKPVLDGIEKQVGQRVRFVRMDVATPNGRRVAAEVGLDLVPLVVGFDAQGSERWRTQRVNRGDLLRRIAML